MYSDLKAEIWDSLLKNITNRLELCRSEKDAAQDAANNEEKSSAGDKYETGRAMGQRQVAELQAQLAQWQQMLDNCLSWKTKGPSLRVLPGSLIRLGGQWMLVGPGLGICETPSGLPFLAVSVSAPVGRMLIGRQKGERVVFQGKETLVEDVL
jgi:hypothetical protein